MGHEERAGSRGTPPSPTGQPLGLGRAFPRALARDVSAVERVMPSSRLGPAGIFASLVCGERLRIPYRIYNPRALGRRGSRAHAGPEDGIGVSLQPPPRRAHSREMRREIVRGGCAMGPALCDQASRGVRRGDRADHPTIPGGPCGPDVGAGRTYGKFVRENPSFIALTAQRGVSYWNCYYRSTCPDPAEYPGSMALARLTDLPGERTATRP